MIEIGLNERVLQNAADRAVVASERALDPGHSLEAIDALLPLVPRTRRLYDTVLENQISSS